MRFFADGPEVLFVEHQTVGSPWQEHPEAGVSLGKSQQRARDNGKAEGLGIGLFNFVANLFVDAMVVFVVVEDFQGLFLEELVPEPDGRDESGGLSCAVCFPQGEAPLEESLRETFIKACELGFVVGNPEGRFFPGCCA
jgi:hypothetical protein